MVDCLFCQIVRGGMPSKKVYEDDQAYAFEDRNPQAPTHILIIPKKHIRGLREAEEQDSKVIGHCYVVAAEIARERKIEDSYRVLCNTGPRAGQSVFHLHFHLLGGRELQWPPG
jgi:histidine triad (HIT) family protein